jgi:hypothetical protein
VGYVEDIQAMELSDEIKQQLISAHRAEVDPLRVTNQSLAAQSKQTKVEAEVEQLKAIGFAESPGLLKFVRRVFLSDDEEPGAVLLSDTEMGLSGDVSTGSTGREEISVAGAIRKFIELLPKNDEGKLMLADQANILEDHGRPAAGEGNESEEEREAERKARANRLAGRNVDRAVSRSKRYGTASVGAGGE